MFGAARYSYGWRNRVSANETELLMTTHVSATLIDGVFKPDDPVPLADQTRVRLTVEPIAERSATGALAWQALKARLKQRPVNSAGLRYTRDELHERR
jgi:hypothetical protein